jgi:hypothetical protein
MNIPKKPGIHFQNITNSKQHNALSIKNNCAKSSGANWENRVCGRESKNTFIKIQIKWGEKRC